MSDKNKIFKDIVNSNNNNNKSKSDKSKQKSILDYFNKKCPQIKRSCDHLFSDNSETNKFNKNNDNYITNINQIEDKTIPVICIEDEDKSDAIKDKSDDIKDKSDVIKDKSDVIKDTEELTNDEFIDLNQYLEIDVSVEDKPIVSSAGDNDTNDDNYMLGSYVYHNFRQMIDFVLEDNHYNKLFDENDLNLIQVFTCLSDLSQILFIRLFMRKRIWIRKNSIKYPEIGDNLGLTLEELVQKKFLFNANSLSDLSESLDILDTNEIKRIGRSLNGLNMNGINTKRNIKNAIIKYLNTCQPVIKSDKHSDSLNEVLLKSIRNVLREKCFRVNDVFCDIFERMFLLFCRPELSDDDFNTQISYEFFKILKIKTGKEVYPKYKINKNAVIYRTREDLLSYSQAFKLEIQLLSAIEDKNFDIIINDLMIRAKQNYFESIKRNVEQDSKLPTFLRRYTSSHTYIRCLSHCVSVLEQRKNYSEAIYLLKDILLSQTIYCGDYRGRWFERLSLNLDKHMKDPISALEIIEKGLSDEFVRTGHRFALYIRLKNIQKSMKTKVKQMTEFEAIKYNETTIFAQTIKYAINDRKNIFKTTDFKGNVTVMPVEDIVINHYKNNGFTDGIHTESRIYHSILCLLFWDIIYMNETQEVVDAFRFQYQRLPLDFNCDQFFIRRKTQIISLLNTLKNMTETEISNILENSWINNFGTVSLINWENNDINQIIEIANCLGTSIITDICERLIQDFRHTRSGFPDLLVWNSLTKRLKAVEVKGPNDRPSTKQQLWLSFLQSIGVDVEICHVKVSKSVPLVVNQ